MIFVYYTGADSFGFEQKDPIRSIGGFVSITRIPKDMMNNLFGDISNYTLQKQSTDTKCIALKNEGASAINDVLIHFETPEDAICDFEIAPVAPSIDDCGNISFEKLSNSESSPYYGDFYNANGESNKINIGSIEPNSYVGLFIKRKFKDSVLENPCVSAEELENQSKKESFDLIVSWS